MSHNTIVGSRGNDHIVVSTSEFTAIRGKRGNDVLSLEHGAGGVLYGGRGKDTLDGGPGSDILWGGKGRDKFVFNDAVSPRNVDAIGDFQPGRDKIVLDLSVFDIPRPNWFGEVITFDTSSGELAYQGNTFAILRGGVQLTEHDFIFIP